MIDYKKNAIDSLPKKTLLTVHEVAEYFSVTKKTVYNWYAEKLLSGCYIGGVLRIYRQSVVVLIESNSGRDQTAQPSKTVPAPQRGRRVISRGID